MMHIYAVTQGIIFDLTIFANYYLSIFTIVLSTIWAPIYSRKNYMPGFVYTMVWYTNTCDRTKVTVNDSLYKMNKIIQEVSVLRIRFVHSCSIFIAVDVLTPIYGSRACTINNIFVIYVNTYGIKRNLKLQFLRH